MLKALNPPAKSHRTARGCSHKHSGKHRKQRKVNNDDSNMAANGICHAANMAGAAWQDAASHYSQNHVIYKPRLFREGNLWCALFGDDLQSGVAGLAIHRLRQCGPLIRNGTRRSEKPNDTTN